MLTLNHSICPECGVGCGINIISKNGKLIGINPYKNHPINEGKNCKNCIDNINNITEGKQQKNYDYSQSILEITEKLKQNQNQEITIVTSGQTDNNDLKKIIEFKNKYNYNILAYENNFTKTDEQLIPSYDEIEEAKQIITIGDIYRNNSLIARKIIHAQENNNAKTININTTKNLTGYNSDEFKQIDSYKEIIKALETIETTDKTFIIINECEDYPTITDYVKDNNLKILPLLKHPNSYSILEEIKTTQKDEIEEIINNSKLLLFINEDPSIFKGTNSKEIIHITPDLTGNYNEIPVRQWCEKEGSYTNSEGLTQEFHDAIKDENNQLLTVEEILEEISKKL